MTRSSLRFAVVLLTCALVLSSACSSDPCSSSEQSVILIGQGVGGEFAEYADGEEVALSIAPQGGFGVSVVLETAGIEASDETRVDISLVTEIDGVQTGEFLLEAAPLLCRSDGEGGSVSGIVVGFDPDTYRSNDDLLALDGEEVELVITVIEADREVEARKPVIVRVGG